jgi:AcrR family transcriptional regulator
MKIAAPKSELGLLAPAHPESGLSSREKLVKSAESLFASKGFREVSVREIAAHAGVNSALVGYYFRGKQALFNEVYRAHAAPLAQERINRLATITSKKRKPSLEEVLKAWVIPWLRVGTDLQDKAIHVRFTANLSMERWENTKRAAPFTQRMHTAFLNALQECLPSLSRETILWRLNFLMGAITFGLKNPGPLLAYSKGKCNPEDMEILFVQILPFAVSGFSAPEPAPQNESKPKGKG